MDAQEAMRVIKRVDAIWPRREAAAEGEYEEWMDFLKPLDGRVAIRAVGELRETMKWRPAMSDFKSAYYVALTIPDAELLALPGKVEQTTSEKNKELYGEDVTKWVYCWRCDMAIPMVDWTMEDREGLRGLVHPHGCPRRGSAPQIPMHEKLAKDDYFRRNGIKLVGR